MELVQVCEDLLASSATGVDEFSERSPVVKSYKYLLESLRKEPFDPSPFLQRVLAAPRGTGGATVHEALAIDGSLSQPRHTLRVLACAKRDGRNVAALLEGVVDQRAGCVVAESSGRTVPTSTRSAPPADCSKSRFVQRG